MKHKRITSRKTIQEVRSQICEVCGNRTAIEPHHINTRVVVVEILERI